MAKEHPEGSAARAECLRAAERLDWEAVDEMTVLGARYRVVRAIGWASAAGCVAALAIFVSGLCPRTESAGFSAFT